ncbi:MAG: prolyl oligopeptidase family serine peptidase [bacterium]
MLLASKGNRTGRKGFRGLGPKPRRHAVAELRDKLCQAYPATLLTAGENATRVHALHARKMAAALQAATASDQNEEPVLLWVDRSAGHGQGKPLADRVSETADQVAFMAWQLGLLVR